MSELTVVSVSVLFPVNGRKSVGSRPEKYTFEFPQTVTSVNIVITIIILLLFVFVNSTTYE